MHSLEKDNVKEISKVLICDDHPVSQLGVMCALQETFPQTNFTFLRASLGKECLQLALNENIDLLVLDLRLPDISGLDVLKTIRATPCSFKIMVLTSEENAHVLVQLLRYNVNAVLLKSYTISMLEAAILHLQNNASAQTYLDPSLEAQLRIEADKQLLSPREFEVLELLLKGHTNKAIAALLKCSPETIKVHRAKIREKTNLKNRDEISAWFHKGIEK